ncbi:hypothetical protein TKK_0015222 [Trichogramma kaykai]
MFLVVQLSLYCSRQESDCAESPLCVVTGVQQLGHTGWSDLKNLSGLEFPLSLYRDEERTFLKYNLPEVIPLRPENYALVSEVYVNDGYASPTDSDAEEDSGPEIQYEAENPGHLTIKLVDAPRSYPKQDESEYEPDTLDRKPPKHQLVANNNNNNCNNSNNKSLRDNSNTEIYVDSLERSTTHILLKSKRSFREDVPEAKNEKKSNETSPADSKETKSVDKQSIFGNRVTSNSKNKELQNGSVDKANEDKGFSDVTIGNGFSRSKIIASIDAHSNNNNNANDQIHRFNKWQCQSNEDNSITSRSVSQRSSRTSNADKSLSSRRSVEDSAYVSSSPESNGSQECRQMQNHHHHQQQQQQQLQQQRTRGTTSYRGSGSESDETNGAANSESGGESVETDSVFFGSYRPREATSQQQQQQQQRPRPPPPPPLAAAATYQDFRLKPRVY